MERNQIIETYLGLAAQAQELEYYWENGTGNRQDFAEALNTATLFYHENNITRQELTEYNDRRRNVVKTDNVNDALSAMKSFFS